MYDDKYQPILVYPTLAAGATLVSTVANWTLAVPVDIIPAATIHTNFLLSIVSVETLDKNGTFELVIYQGAADLEVSRVRFSVLGGFFGNSVFVLPGALITAEARVRGSIAYSAGAGGAATATVSLGYRPVP
jgi:hypothetical protein